MAIVFAAHESCRLPSVRSLASFGGVSAGLAFTLRCHILVDALGNAGIPVSLPISSADRCVCQRAVTIINCTTHISIGDAIINKR